jgi:inosose dehydratase
MSVRLAINPITWSNDDHPSLGGDIPLETCLRETREAGFAGTEFGFKFPRSTPELSAVLRKHDLELVSAWYDGRILDKEIEAEYDAILPHLTMLKDQGCKLVVYADTSRGRHGGIFQPASQRPKLADDEWTAYSRKITALAEKFADFGVRMAFHHHMGTFVETDAEVDRLMAGTGEAVGLLFDTGHCVYAHGNPQALLERHIGRINHVHCKDIRRPVLEQAWAGDWSFMDAVLAGIFTVPGDGSVDYPPLLRRLQAAGYEGWLVVEAEQDPAKANPLTYATMGYRNLVKLARDAGMQVVEGAKSARASA